MKSARTHVSNKQHTNNITTSTRTSGREITDFDTHIGIIIIERIISLHLVEHCVSIHGTCYLIKGIFSVD